MEDASQAPTRTLTLADIKAAPDTSAVPPQRVDVPEWGGAVYVKLMTGLEKERYVKSIRRTVGRGRKRRERVELEHSGAALVVATLCDEHGVLLATAADIPALSAKSAVALQRVIDAAATLNGLDDDAEEEAGNASASETETSGSSSV